MKFFKEVKKYWRFAVYAAKSDLQEEVANSYLNWLWWILEPLSSMLVYVLIFGIVLKTDEAYFPIFVFIGITVWDYFGRCITSSVDLIRNNQHIISRIYIPKYILLIQRMLVLIFKMLICWGIVALMMIIYKIPIGINLLYMIPNLVVFFYFLFCLQPVFSPFWSVCQRSFQIGCDCAESDVLSDGYFLQYTEKLSGALWLLSAENQSHSAPDFLYAEITSLQ